MPPVVPATTAARLRRASSLRPRLAMILGSGFNHVLRALEVETRVPFARLPGFSRTGVAGHAGEAVFGKLAGTPVLVLSGRAHYYEGHAMDAVTFPVRVLAELGVTDLLLTNAAGGINARHRPGDFMRIVDHINFMGVNPLRGPVAPGRERFVDLTGAYDPVLGKLLTSAARRAKVRLHTGVYLAVSGPSFETPAEIRAFRRLGADAVGMSTVPEVIVARQCGLRVAGLSCITNAAAGMTGRPLSHQEVLDAGKASQAKAVALLEAFARHFAATARIN
jgi:purine-nucleoside phosphorylase